MQLACIKNFILVGDVMKSVDLLVFQKDYRTLAVISRDVRSMEVFACEFAVDGAQLAFLVTDADKNLVMFAYQPEARYKSKRNSNPNDTVAYVVLQWEVVKFRNHRGNRCFRRLVPGPPQFARAASKDVISFGMPFAAFTAPIQTSDLLASSCLARY